MGEASLKDTTIGLVIASPTRPATATTVWIELAVHNKVALHDFIIVESPGHALLGVVVEIEKITNSPLVAAKEVHQRSSQQLTCAKLAILSTSDMRHRPPDGIQHVSHLRRNCQNCWQRRGKFLSQNAFLWVLFRFKGLSLPCMLIFGGLWVQSRPAC